MTPEQKIKWKILNVSARYEKTEQQIVTEDNIDELYDALVDADLHWDAMEEVRQSGQKTGIKSERYSRHYECEEVAAKMPDGSWVGWTYWHGGGKHGEPSAMDWMEYAYDVDCRKEMREVEIFEREKT